jgi:uncharacterized MAPEG superfamily protein
LKDNEGKFMRSVAFELVGLTAAVGLGIAHIVLASHSASWQRGYRWSAGPRDDALAPLSGIAGRLSRASANFQETFPFFAAGVLAVLMTASQSTWSKWGVSMYLFGRLSYLPLYAAGTFLVRSFAWNVATFGIAAVFVALFV